MDNVLTHPHAVALYGAGGLIPLTIGKGRHTFDPGYIDVVSKNAVGARRVTRRRSRARSWTYRAETTLNDAQNILAASETLEEYFFCSYPAQIHNLLPGGFAWPRTGSPAIAVTGEAVTVSDYSAYPTAHTPVRPGKPVTVGVFIQGSGRVNLVFYDVAGTEVGRESQAFTQGQLTRETITSIAPAQAVTARISASGFTLYGGPSLTWTDKPTAYMAPAGIPHAVVQLAPWSADPIRCGEVTLLDVEFTVLEVG